MSSPGRRSWFSIGAIFCSVVGLVVPPLALIAITLGILVIRHSHSVKSVRLAQFAIGLSCTGLVVVTGLLWAQRGNHEREAECQIGLEALSLAQDAHRKTRGRFAATAGELGWPITRQYFLDVGGAHEAALQKLKVGPAGRCPDCTITMACLDEDARTWWTITTGGKPTAHVGVQ